MKPNRPFSLPATCLLGVLFVSILFGCASAVPTATPGHRLLYALNFENQAAFAGWHVGAPGQYEWLKNVKNGKYRFEYPSGFLESQDFDFADVQVAVDVEFLLKTRVEAGLACRMQPGASGRYYFTIANDGRWSIRNGETVLAEGWSDQIKADKNRLAARCVGNQLTLLVNDVELGSARDGAFASGSLNFGYAADTSGAGTFDNILVEDWGSGQAAVSQPEPEKGEVIYAEDFDHPDQLSGWDAKLDEKSQANPQDGAYRLAGDSSMAAFIQREQTFSDALIEVDVKILGPARVGVLCRNETGNYAFTLTDSGAWAIEHSGKPLTSGSTNLHSGFNHLSISCIGDRLGFVLNGEALGEVQDASFQQGQIGFTLESMGKAEALFDNLTVRRPAERAVEAASTPVAALEPATQTPLPASTATPTLMPTPVATLRPTLIPEGELALYETEFDDSDPTLADWKTFAFSMDKKDFVSEGYKTWTINGIYRFEQEANTRVFAIYNKDLGTADVDISMSGNPPFEGHGGLGLVCRYSQAGWYQFMVEPNGGVWTIRLVKPDENGKYHFHIIASGGKWFGQKVDLRAECKGDRLTFYIDGEKMASLHDSTFPTGKVGFLGWAFAIGDDWNTVDKFSARRAQWNETDLPGPAPTPGADGMIYNTEFAKLDDMKTYWTKVDLGVQGVPGSPLLVGGPGQISPHLYQYINDFDPDPNVEITSDIRGTINLARGIICRYSEDGWYETFYMKDDPSHARVALVLGQRDEQGKLTRYVLDTYYPPKADGLINLALTCAGNQISVKANGEQVLYAEDNTWQTGRYGFFFTENPPGDFRSNVLLNYSVRSAQAIHPGDVIFEKNLNTPEKIMTLFTTDKSVKVQDGVIVTDPNVWFNISTGGHLPKDIDTTIEVQFLNSDGFVSLECRNGLNPPAFQLRPDGSWAIFADDQMKANGRIENLLLDKNQIRARCIGHELTLAVNGETISSVDDKHVDERAGQINIVAFEGMQFALHSVHITATQSLTPPPVLAHLNQVVLSSTYKPGETIFAWDMNNFVSGCGGGWWGRDPNPCLWRKAYNRFVITEHHTDSDILVTPNDKMLTLFTYQPDLYDLPVEISADATLTSKGGGVALFCRATAVGRYEFYIQPDGKWFIRRNVIAGDYLPKAKHLTTLAQGAVENFSPENMQLNATCNGPDLIFSVNGAELGRVQDTLYPEGQVGLFFDVFSEGSFTNLTINLAK